MCPKHLRLLAYSLGHFWVDFSCALLMFSRLSGQSGWALCVLLYNFCAFALQMPVGLLADRWERKGRTAALGCGLAALGWVLPPFLAAVIAGVGNACFHVGGGIQATGPRPWAFSSHRAPLASSFVPCWAAGPPFPAGSPVSDCFSSP